MCVCVDQCQRHRVSELQRAAAFGTQLPSAERQTRGRRRERDWTLRPPITHRPLKSPAVLFSLDVFPNHLFMSFHHAVQTVFFPSKHSFFINKGFPVRCLIKNSPLSTEVLTTVERFSLSNQTRAKNTRKTDSTHFLHVVYSFEHVSVLNLFLPQCFYLQRSSPLLEKVQMHSYPWQSTNKREENEE